MEEPGYGKSGKQSGFLTAQLPPLTTVYRGSSSRLGKGVRHHTAPVTHCDFGHQLLRGAELVAYRTTRQRCSSTMWLVHVCIWLEKVHARGITHNLSLALTFPSHTRIMCYNQFTGGKVQLQELAKPMIVNNLDKEHQRFSQSFS